jgi:hypothetical protein
MKQLHKLKTVLDVVVPLLFIVGWAKYLKCVFGSDSNDPGESFYQKYIVPIKDAPIWFKIPFVGVLAYWLLVFAVNKKSNGRV